MDARSRGTLDLSRYQRSIVLARAVALGVASVVLISSCGEPAAGTATSSRNEPGSEAPTREWAVQAAPVVEIGVADGAEAYLFQDITSVAVLENGNIAVLDAGPAQLRFYDTAGRHLRTTGGKGSGPGEYRAPARIYATHSDTLLIFDSGTQMETTVDSGGVFVRAVRWEAPPQETFKRDAWLWRRVFVDGPARIEERGGIARALARLPGPDGPDGFLYVKVDPFGRLWSRSEPHDPERPSTWHVFDSDGEPLAAVTTPGRFQLQHIGSDRLAGRAWDEMGVERVLVLAYDGQPPPRSAIRPEPLPGPSAVPEDVLHGMRGLLRDAVSQQEIFYSKDYRYAWRVDQLGWPEHFEGYTVHITASSPRGYTMLILHESTDGVCGVSIGMGGPVGWTPGVVQCSH